MDLPEIVKRAATLHSAIAADLEPSGGILRCGTCRTEQPLGDIADSLRHGWPECCGHTMRWVTQRQLDEEAPEGPPCGWPGKEDGDAQA